MPKMVVYEVYEIVASDVEEAEKKAREESKRRKSVIVAARELRSLPHPVHLQETNDMFGSIGDGGKAQ